MSDNFYRLRPVNCHRLRSNCHRLRSANRCPLGSVQRPRIASRWVCAVRLGPWPGLFHYLTLRKRKGPRNGGPDRRCGAAGVLNMVNRDSDITVADHVLHFVADRVGSSAGVF